MLIDLSTAGSRVIAKARLGKTPRSCRGGFWRYANRWRPMLMLLERREVPSCAQPGSPPWCFDLAFDTDGQTKGNIPVRFEEARAMLIQKVDIDPGPGTILQERTLLAGHAIIDIIPPQAQSDTAILRLCPNGKLDNGINCEGSGFGDINPWTQRAPGYKVINFYSIDRADDPFEEEIITALAMQPNQHSDVCDGTDPSKKSDKIIAVARIPVKQFPPVDDTIGVIRYCADGRLDTDTVNWKSGLHPDWSPEPTYVDPVGMISLGWADNIGLTADWTRDVWPFAVAIEELNPNNKKIIVGGYGLFPKPTEKHLPVPDENRAFVLARLCENGQLDDGVNCGAGGFGENIGTVDFDPGRIHFDGAGGYRMTHIRSEVRGLQLVQHDPAGLDFTKWDILITGPDQLRTEDHRDIFVARIDYDGKGDNQGDPPWEANWPLIIDYPAVEPRTPTTPSLDDIATDMVYHSAGKQLFITGASCTKTTNFACIHDPLRDSPYDASLASDMVFARVDLLGSSPVLTYKKRLNQGPLGSATHTDVAYSIVLQPDPADPLALPPLVLIGGYSVESNDTTPFMSGARFNYSNPDVVTYTLRGQE